MKNKTTATRQIFWGKIKNSKKILEFRFAPKI